MRDDAADRPPVLVAEDVPRLGATAEEAIVPVTENAVREEPEADKDTEDDQRRARVHTDEFAL